MQRAHDKRKLIEVFVCQKLS